MHITRKALITILACLVVILLGYDYYQSKHPYNEESIVPYKGLITLRVGETTSFDKLSIFLNGIPEDSRCPRGKECIRNGYVTARVTLSIGEVSTTTTLSSVGNEATFGGYHIFIQNVIPQANEVGSSTLYEVTFKVKRPSLPQ